MIFFGEMSETPTEPVPAPTAPAPEPVQAPALPSDLTPVVGPLMALLKSRKGVVMLGAVAFCAVVYLRDPSKLDKLISFLSYVLTVWFGSHAWQESKSNGK